MNMAKARMVSWILNVLRHGALYASPFIWKYMRTAYTFVMSTRRVTNYEFSVGLSQFRCRRWYLKGMEWYGTCSINRKDSAILSYFCYRRFSSIDTLVKKDYKMWWLNSNLCANSEGGNNVAASKAGRQPGPMPIAEWEEGQKRAATGKRVDTEKRLRIPLGR